MGHGGRSPRRRESSGVVSCYEAGRKERLVDGHGMDGARVEAE